MLVAGVDSSTQSTKVVLCQAEDGTIVGTASAPHPDGTECDPEYWWAALRRAGDGLLDRADAVGVAAQQHGMIAVDAAGEVIRPAILWNDMRAAPQTLELITELGGPAEWARRTGSVPAVSFTVTKLRWMAEREPQSAERLSRVMLPHDWLTWRLGADEPVTDRGDASGTGYFSPAEGKWLPDIAEMALGRPVATPRLAGPAEVVGRTPAGAVLAPGTGDNMAGALGLGLRAGDVAVSIGTSGTVFATSDHPAQDPTGAVAGFADATGRFLPLVCTLNATLVTNAVARLLDVDFATLEKLALGAPAGSGGVTLVPYLAGERTPNRPEATGTLFGIRTDVSRELVARAAFEGVVCGLLEGLDALNVVGVPTTGQLLLIGGGAKSRAYREVLATLSNRSVVVPDETEIVAAGACVQAAIMESTSDVDAIVNSWSLGSGEIVEPGNGSLDAEGIRHRYASARG